MFLRFYGFRDVRTALRQRGQDLQQRNEELSLSRAVLVQQLVYVLCPIMVRLAAGVKFICY